jgi:uncharacterized protein (UPF0276 family)
MGLAGVGVGHRAELSGALLREPSAVDLVELLFERAASSRGAHREAEAVAEMWPVAVHGVKLSLGSAEGIDEERARRLGAFARAVRAEVVSEHASFVRAGGVEIGHLTATPFTLDAARVIARNVARAQRHLPDVPFLVENVAWSMRFSEDALPEGAFHREIVERAGVGLLLDLGNVLANAKNAGVDPVALLETYPVERARLVHIAGGLLDGGFYFDTHGHAVGDEVFELLEVVVRRAGAVPVVLERDERFPAFEEIAREVARARAIVGSASPRSTPAWAAPHRSTSEPSSEPAPEPGSAEPLAALEAALARALWTGEGAARFDEAAVRRTQAILRKKRVDDALPLLPRLSAHGREAHAIAEAVLAASPKSASRAAVVDAFTIAERALAVARLREAASIDQLALEAAFVRDATGSVAPRRGPFLASRRTAHGKVWAMKGLGATASVHVRLLAHPPPRSIPETRETHG